MQYILTTTKTIYEECNGIKALRHKKGTKVFMSEKYFNVMFANYEENSEGDFTIEQFNLLTLEDKGKTVEGLYLQKNFFSTVEDGYQKLLTINN